MAGPPHMRVVVAVSAMSTNDPRTTLGRCVADRLQNATDYELTAFVDYCPVT